MTYAIEYQDGEAIQTQGPMAPQQGYPPPYYAAPPRQGFRVPSIVKTGATFLAGAALFFGLEIYGPEQLRPSTGMGIYHGRVEGVVREAEKAAELRVQARYEVWASQVKARADQQTEQYKMLGQTVATYYNGAVERSKTYAVAATQLQAQIAAAQMQKTQAEQSGEVGVISLGRVFGELWSKVDPATGGSVLEYTAQRSEALSAELSAAALRGVAVKIDGWDTDLPSPLEVQQQLLSIKPLELPPSPAVGGTPATPAPR